MTCCCEIKENEEKRKEERDREGWRLDKASGGVGDLKKGQSHPLAHHMATHSAAHNLSAIAHLEPQPPEPISLSTLVLHSPLAVAHSYRLTMRCYMLHYMLRHNVNAETARASNNSTRDTLLAQRLQRLVVTLDLGDLVHVLEGHGADLVGSGCA